MYERLLDKENEPTKEELTRYCKENSANFQKLNNLLREKYHTTEEIRFPYGKKYGWCITHRRAKRLICDIFAESGAFTVMLRLSDKQYAASYTNVGEYMQQQIDNRYPCGDGGWIHYRVALNEHLKDIETLLSIKCE